MQKKSSITSYKEEKTEEERKNETSQLIKKFPDKIPIILQKHRTSKL